MWTKIDYNDKSTLPKENQLVWLTGFWGGTQKWICLGCKGITDCIDDENGWSWSWCQLEMINGSLFVENNKIFGDCESDELEPTHWHPVPELPNIE